MKFLQRFGGVKIAVLILAVAGVGGGYATYRYLFKRTGEAAIAMIPSDASLVITIDTHPSEAQITAFQKLGDALKREGIDGDIEDGVSGIIGKAGLAKEVRQYLTNNVAMAMWMPADGGAKTHGLMLLSISDPSAVEKAIAGGTKAPGASIPAYTYTRQDMVVGVVGDYLAIASDVDTLNRAEQTRGGGESVANLQEYRDARGALPTDANLMCFMSPSMIAQASKMSGAKAFGSSKWMAMGASLRDGGLRFDYRGPVDTKKFPVLASMVGGAYLDPKFMKKLPEGAYGLMAYSDLSRFYPAVQQSVQDVRGEKRAQDELAKFEQESGISVENDLLPALKGDAIVAVYPGAVADPTSFDGVIMIDTANGGEPAKLADKLRAFVERKSAETAAKGGSNKAVHFTETKMGSATVWQLDAESVSGLRDALGHRKPDGSREVPPAMADKNVMYAVVDNAVILASSQAMMNQALLSANGGKSLADDLAFTNMAAEADPKAQMVGFIAISRIVDKYRAQIQDGMKNANGITIDDIVNAFGGPNTGLSFSGHMDGEVASGTMFLPLDYDRLAKFIGAAKRQTKAPPLASG